MGAGFRGVPELSGVTLSKAPGATANPGLTLGKLLGVWVDGPAPAVVNPGLQFGQLIGVWITGAPAATIKSGWPTAPPIAYRQYQEPTRVRIRYTQADMPDVRPTMMARLRREDEELILILAAAAAGGVFDD